MMDENALFKLTHGLYVLGAADAGGRLVGSVVDAVMQVANRPFVLALSCTNNSYTKHCIEASNEFSLSVLGKMSILWLFPISVSSPAAMLINGKMSNIMFMTDFPTCKIIWRRLNVR